jgi:hypothetical protein
MNPSLQRQGTAKRQCAYCGRFAPSHLIQCPDCRETLPQIAVVSPPPVKKRTEIRRGLLYMLLAAVIYYFAGGYSAMNLPFPINPLVTVYLSPLLFVSGLGLTIFGFYARSRA